MEENNNEEQVKTTDNSIQSSVESSNLEQQTNINNKVQTEQVEQQVNVVNDEKKKKNNKVLLVVIILIILVSVIAVIYFFISSDKNNKIVNNDETTAETSTTAEQTTEVSSNKETKSIVVYQETILDETSTRIGFSDDYEKDKDYYSYKILYQYNCSGDCIVKNNNINGESGSDYYVYDNGKIYKTDLSSDFKEITVNINTLEIESEIYGVDVKIMYFNDDDNFIGFESKLDGTMLKNNINEEYEFFYNKGLLENGYIIILPVYLDDGSIIVYDYKNDVIKYSGIRDDNMNPEVYENFVVIDGIGIISNNAVKISDDDFCGYGGCSISVTNDYVYIPDYDNGKINIYDKNGNISTISDYSYVLKVYDKYAYVLDSNLDLKIIDMSANKVLADFNVTLSNTSSGGQIWELYDNQIWFSNEECRTDSEETLWYYYDVNTGEYGSTGYFNSTCT